MFVAMDATGGEAAAAAKETPFTAADAARCIAVPTPDDDKYSRGVVGFVTGSTRYPGAAVLGVEAALHTGVGMARYVGADVPSTLVLQRRPETVLGVGKVQAWVLGSGQDSELEQEFSLKRAEAVADSLPTVLDAGALGLALGPHGPVVLTPHLRELGALLGLEHGEVDQDPIAAARRAARDCNAVVLLKGHVTRVVAPAGDVLRVENAPSWLATAGSGDALAGILGALLATHAAEVAADADLLPKLAATAAYIHGAAATTASAGGPFTVLALCAAIPGVVAQLVGTGGAKPAPRKTAAKG